MRKMCRDSISALQTRAPVPADASTGARHGVWSETSKEDKVFQRYVYVIDCDLLLVLVVGLCSACVSALYYAHTLPPAPLPVFDNHAR